MDLDGTIIPPKILELYNKIMNQENKREGGGAKNFNKEQMCQNRFKAF